MKKLPTCMEKLPIYALIMSAMIILYFVPIWGILPWNTEVTSIPLSVASNQPRLILAIVTLVLSIVYLVIRRVYQSLKSLCIVISILSVIIALYFIMYTYGIFLFELTFPRQH